MIILRSLVFWLCQLLNMKVKNQSGNDLKSGVVFIQLFIAPYKDNFYVQFKQLRPFGSRYPGKMADHQKKFEHP